MSDRTPDGQQVRHFASIDALRGVAALAVVVYHHFRDYVRFLPDWADRIVYLGPRGVQLFYLLSAFTLFMSLHQRERLGTLSRRAFFLRRLFRIAPPFWLALAFYLWYLGRGPRYALGDETQVTLANILANALFVNGFNPYWINSIVPVGWSVAVEMPFYLLVPFLFARIRRPSQAALFTAVAFVAGVALNGWLRAHPLIAHRGLWNNFLIWWLPNQLPVFGMGIMLYFMVIGDEGRQWGPAARRRAGRCLLALSLLLLALFARLQEGHPLRHMFYGLIFLVLCWGLWLHPSRLLVNRFTRFAGTISYSIYLSHMAIIPAVRQLLRALFAGSLHPLAHMALSTALTFGLTILVSTVTWRLVEKPSQDLGSLLIRRTRRR